MDKSWYEDKRRGIAKRTRKLLNRAATTNAAPEKSKWKQIGKAARRQALASSIRESVPLAQLKPQPTLTTPQLEGHNSIRSAKRRRRLNASVNVVSRLFAESCQVDVPPDDAGAEDDHQGLQSSARGSRKRDFKTFEAQMNLVFDQFELGCRVSHPVHHEQTKNTGNRHSQKLVCSEGKTNSKRGKKGKHTKRNKL